MKRRLLFILVAGVAAPLAAQQPPTAAEIVKRMTPEERALAQRKLNDAAAFLYSEPIDSVKAELRATLVVMRDSMLAVVAETARLERTNAPAVILAVARRLRGNCAAAGRTALTTQAKVQQLRTSAAEGDRALTSYRTTLAETTRILQQCDRALATTLQASVPSAVRIRETAASLVVAANRYEAATDGVLRALSIPLRPKGIP